MKALFSSRPAARGAGWGNAARHRRISVLLAGAALFACGMLGGLIISFPAASLEKRILSEVESRGRVKIDAGQLRLWPPYKIEGTNLAIRFASSAWPPVHIDSLRLSPEWLSLLSANPAVHCRMRLMNGHLHAKLSCDGAMKIDAANLTFDYPLLSGSQLRLSGRLATGEIQGGLPLVASTKSDFRLDFSDVKLLGIEGRGEGLTLGDVVLRVAGNGNLFEIATMEARGGQFALNGTGSLVISAVNLPASRFALQLAIIANRDTDPMLISLLDLVAHKKGDSRYEVRMEGSLSRPLMK